MDKIDRLWGTYEVIRETPQYKIKLLRLNPNAAISKQYHTKRNEFWTIIEGQAYTEIDGRVSFLTENNSIYIPKGVIHYLKNISSISILEVLELQTGTYFGEDDIIRL